MSLREDVTVRAVIKRRVAAPRQRVFRAWTSAEQLQRWFFPSIDADAMPQAEVDLRAGGCYRITMCAPDGSITAVVGGAYHEVRPPEKLVFSWAWEAPRPEPSKTLATVELHDVQGATEIIITHEHFPDPTDRERPTIGWNCSLERLTRLIEGASSRHLLAASGDPCRQ